MSVNLNCGYVLEEEAKIFNHGVFSCRLWASHAAFVVAACGDHVARGAVRWATYHVANKVHLSCGNHVAYTGDGVEHLAQFVIA